MDRLPAFIVWDDDEIRMRWPALTAEDIATTGYDVERLAVRIVERYGIAWDLARSDIARWHAARIAASARNDTRRSTMSDPGNALQHAAHKGVE